MSDIRILSVAAEILETPLHSPFVTSKGRADKAEAVIVRFGLSDGTSVFGEATPVEYVTGETITSVLATVERTGAQLLGMAVDAYRPLLTTIAECAPAEPSARCSMEMAAFTAWAKAQGCSLVSLFGGAKEEVESDITIPIVPEAAELANFAYEAGMRVLKIKVGGGCLDADMARVVAVHEAAPEARFRIDANQGFTVQEALDFAHRLVDAGIPVDLLEQPVPMNDFIGMATIAELSPLPIFADESVRTPADALRLAQTPVHGFNCKINKNGIAGVLDIIAIARTAGKKLMLGCMLETRRSIGFSLALACGTGAFDYIDLDSHLLLNEAGANHDFSQVGARMSPMFPERG